MTYQSAVGMNYIAGNWQHRADIIVFDPARQEPIGNIPYSEWSEVHCAVSAAQEAFRVWGDNSKWSWVRRAEVIDDMVQLARAHQDEIAVLVSLECGKHINEGKADVIEGIHMLQYCAGRGRHPIGYKISSEIPEKEAETYMDPRGVCSVITPWNFPFAIPTWLIGPALVSGNTVVFKPSEETPLSGQFLVHLFDEAAKKHGVPPGVLNLVHGPGEVGEHMVRHRGTVGQLFTGSFKVGQKIRRIATDHWDKFAICEMGGKNSLIVLEDADIELAVNAAILSAYKTTHQRCVSADLLIVQESIEQEFTRQFLEMTDRIVFGSPFDEKSFAGPLINQKAVQKFNDHAQRVFYECPEVLRRFIGDEKNNFVRPNVFRMRYRPDTFALREEAFTPNIVIVPVKDFEEAMQVANDNNGCLSMSLMSGDYRMHRAFKIRSRAGLKYVQLPTIGAEIQLPFGGERSAGTGVPSAAFLFNHLCYETAFTVNYGNEIRLAQGLSARVA